MFEHVAASCNCSGKFCRGCQSLVCIGNFWKSRSRCIPCEKKAFAEWQAKNPERNKQRARDWREENIERVKATNKQWREENKEYDKERQRRWYEENKDRANATWQEWKAKNDRSPYHKAYRQANIEKLKEKDRRTSKSPQKAAYRKRRYAATRERQIKTSLDWQKNNPARHAANEQRRRAIKTASGGSYTLAEWEALKRQYNYTCLSCGRQEPEIRLTVDHIIPVTKGGSSFIDNLQPLCFSCNSSKNNKVIDYRPKY